MKIKQIAWIFSLAVAIALILFPFLGCANPQGSDKTTIVHEYPPTPTQPPTPSGYQFDSPWIAQDCDDVAYCEGRLHTLYFAGKADYTMKNAMLGSPDSPVVMAELIDELTSDVNNAALNAWKADPNAKFHVRPTGGGFSMEYKFDYRVDVGNGLKRVPCMSSAHLRAGAQHGIDRHFSRSPLWSTLSQNSQLLTFVVRDR
jgi:hypothetical protein